MIARMPAPQKNTDICMISGMKTTLDLNDRLVAEAKARAVRERTTLTRLVEEGLRWRLSAQATAVKATRPSIPVYRGRGGLRPGIDATSNRALLDAAGDDT